jgi:hypothetical protein
MGAIKVIKADEIQMIEPGRCGFIEQNGDFYPTIGFDAKHMRDGNFLWQKEDLSWDNTFALSQLELPAMIEEYKKFIAIYKTIDPNSRVAQYIADRLAFIKFSRLHEERLGRAIDRTIQPRDKGLITAQALLTLSWLYGINYNSDPNFIESQTESVKELRKKIGTKVF